ncbi:MAG: hypothetical protein JWO10_271 [Microbacteriaceae bacterium]|nr:hypothetical protein [Microbacteriaceae bacterium]
MSLATPTAEQSGSIRRIASLVTVAWAALALLAQVVFAFAMAPQLPMSIRFYFAVRNTPGNDGIQAPTATMVGVGWGVAIAAVLVAIACLYFAPRNAGWAIILSILLCAVVPLAIGIVLTNGAVNLVGGVPTPGQQLLPAIAGIVGIVAGVYSCFRLPRRVVMGRVVRP